MIRQNACPVPRIRTDAKTRRDRTLAECVPTSSPRREAYSEVVKSAEREGQEGTRRGATETQCITPKSPPSNWFHWVPSPHAFVETLTKSNELSLRNLRASPGIRGARNGPLPEG